MYQDGQFAQVLLRNEDWLLSKILSVARSYKEVEYLSLINFTWRETIHTISKTALSTFKQTPSVNYKLLNQHGNTSLCKNLIYSEAKQCINRHIKPHTYLSFLKNIREIYKELITGTNIKTEDKNTYQSHLENCFNTLEITFIKEWTDVSNSNTLHFKPPIKTENQNDLFKDLPIPILLIDPFHRVLSKNSAANKFFDYSNSNQNPKPSLLSFFNNNEILNSKIDSFRISEQTETQFELQLFIKNKNCFTLINLAKTDYSNAIILSLIDLTHWKNIEQSLKKSKNKAEETDRLKTSFIANMSHEIRTPMNAIIGFSELIHSSNPKKKERDQYLSLIKKSSNDLLNIIEDILDITKIESKQLKITNTATKPAEIFSDLNQIYKQALTKQEKHDVELIFNIPKEEENLTLRTDHKRLKQILSNLIGNAIKFTNKGHIEIGYKMADSKLVYFYVKDTGIGIPYNMQKRIFNRFVQVDETMALNKNGTGLGLAISKSLVNLLGGNIWVTSSPNKGANFYFYLPNIKPELLVKPNTQPLKKQDRINLASKTILIAEDEDSNFIYLREVLKDTGIKIHRATTGIEAINLAETLTTLDLILMDVKMPELNGIDAAQYIRHTNPNIPIIALTAYAMDPDKIACIDAGCNAYLSKPIKQKDLIALIQKHTINRKLQTRSRSLF
jgi:signal transduction histidine kinase/ActR/RegA family two-component response regulator